MTTEVQKEEVPKINVTAALSPGAEVKIIQPEDPIIRTFREKRKTIWLILCCLVIIGALGVSVYNIIMTTASVNLAWGLLGTLLGIVLKDIGKLFE